MPVCFPCIKLHRQCQGTLFCEVGFEKGYGFTLEGAFIRMPRQEICLNFAVKYSDGIYQCIDIQGTCMCRSIALLLCKDQLLYTAHQSEIWLIYKVS